VLPVQHPLFVVEMLHFVWHKEFGIKVKSIHAAGLDCRRLAIKSMADGSHVDFQFRVRLVVLGVVEDWTEALAKNSMLSVLVLGSSGIAFVVESDDLHVFAIIGDKAPPDPGTSNAAHGAMAYRGRSFLGVAVQDHGSFLVHRAVVARNGKAVGAGRGHNVDGRW